LRKIIVIHRFTSKNFNSRPGVLNSSCLELSETANKKDNFFVEDNYSIKQFSGNIQYLKFAKIIFRFWAVPRSGTEDKISKSQGVVLENKKARGEAQNQWAALCAAPRSLTVVQLYNKARTYFIKNS
jgi:hypothetical protein